jgi:hypothetical protein
MSKKATSNPSTRKIWGFDSLHRNWLECRRPINKGGMAVREVIKGVWEWSWFSEEKKIDFNGHLIEIEERRWMVDPPPLSQGYEAKLLKGKGIDGILITNRDHVREAERYRILFGTRILMPESDAPLVDTKVDKTFRGGERLPGGIEVIPISHGKSPGESALRVPVGGGVLILGDALIGKPEGDLNLLPANMFADVGKAREGLQILLNYSYDMVLVGDGVSVLKGGRAAVEVSLSR